jgi:hypothetical protein
VLIVDGKKGYNIGTTLFGCLFCYSVPTRYSKSLVPFCRPSQGKNIKVVKRVASSIFFDAVTWNETNDTRRSPLDTSDQLSRTREKWCLETAGPIIQISQRVAEEKASLLKVQNKGELSKSTRTLMPMRNVRKQLIGKSFTFAGFQGTIASFQHISVKPHYRPRRLASTGSQLHFPPSSTTTSQKQTLSSSQGHPPVAHGSRHSL